MPCEEEDIVEIVEETDAEKGWDDLEEALKVKTVRVAKCSGGRRQED